MSGTLTRTRLARAQRESLALSSKRATPCSRVKNAFPETEGDSEAAPVKYKTGKMKRAALV
jgi:hypothetical protein